VSLFPKHPDAVHRHPDAHPPANVVVLHPDGITIRNESPRHWIGRRIGGRPVSETAYDMGELFELREKLNRYIEEFER
jgi:hypothetical protein